MMMLRKLIGGWRVDKEQILPSGKGLNQNGWETTRMIIILMMMRRRRMVGMRMMMMIGQDKMLKRILSDSNFILTSNILNKADNDSAQNDHCDFSF